MAKFKEILRWATIILCWGWGGYFFYEGFRGFFIHPAMPLWMCLSVFLFVFVPLGIVPLFIGYFALRRQYLNLCKAVSFIGALFLVEILISLPIKLHWMQTIDHNKPWMILLGLPLSLIFLIGPYIAGIWFYKNAVEILKRRFGFASLSQIPNATGKAV